MRVAITGGIGEGKSTVLAMLSEMGRSTLSADAVARELFETAQVRAQLAEIAELSPDFGAPELRAALARSGAVRRRVNRLMHPLVMREIDERQATFVEVPLLIEACLQSTFNQVWVVTCGREEQVRRLMARYGDFGHVERMLATQLPTRAKIPFADLTVRTNEPLDHVRRLLSEAVTELEAGELRVG